MKDMLYATPQAVLLGPDAHSEVKEKYLLPNHYEKGDSTASHQGNTVLANSSDQEAEIICL